MENSQNFETAKSRRYRNPTEKLSAGNTILNRYQVVNFINEGTTGFVYKCIDSVTNVNVAIKAVSSTAFEQGKSIDFFEEKFSIASKLTHRNIVNYKRFIQDSNSGTCYLIIDYVDGENFREWLKRKCPNEDIKLNLNP